MSRRFSIVYAIVVFAFVTDAFGCSSGVAPTQAPHSGMAGIDERSQSLGSWTTKASMPTARDGLAAGVVNGILYAVGGCCVNDINSFNVNEAFNPR
jgi:hypothetical protein